MIVKCTICDSLMRVDPERLITGKTAKVRCPRCQGIGLIRGRPSVRETLKPEPIIPGATELLPYSSQSTDSLEKRSHKDLSEVEDDYIFPSEQNDFSYGRTVEGRAIRTFLWIMGSLIVILLFAMVVNFILPGPPR